MNPKLRALLGDLVRFRPSAAKDVYGAAGWGALSAQMPCRVQLLPQNRQTITVDREKIEAGGVIYVDNDQYNPATWPVGSLVVLPDGRERQIVNIDEFHDETGAVDHWRLTFGVR